MTRLICPTPVARAQERLDMIAAEPSVFLVYPGVFVCDGCGLEWDADPPMSIDLKDVTCSNCYGEQVYMVSVKVKTFEGRRDA